MNTLGQVCLLIAFVGSGYAAFACMLACYSGRRLLGRSGEAAAVASFLTLTAVTAVLAWALTARDFRFAYVAEYTSRSLPWHYSLSALWVGQAGSLLLWAWLLGAVALAYRFWPGQRQSRLRGHAFGLLMAYLWFLGTVMLFGADPMEPSLGTPQDGAGLSPLLEHPAMLIHPPIVFLGYAGWAVPFALAITALLRGHLDADWVREARPWALFAWAVLGSGIWLGALWAYDELGWGGYWSWDPVENGSLIPWLAGTALVHALLAWQYRGVYKKTTVSLAVATFGLCNFATFLTRSGVFSSLHAFSESPIGWMFLAFMAALGAVGAILLVRRRAMLRTERPITSIWARESFVLLGAIALLLLAAVALAGTLAAPLSGLILGQAIVVGPPFYNNVLIPTGLVLLVTTGAAPLLKWGAPPGPGQRRMLFLSAIGASAGPLWAFAVGIRHPVALAVAWASGFAVVALVGAFALEAARRPPDKPWLGLLGALRHSRRQYAGFVVHLGFVLLAVGVTGSSLGTRRISLVMDEGQCVEWAGRRIRFVGLTQHELPDKLVAQARLEISHRGKPSRTLLPAQHLHFPRDEWTTEVAIHSTWGGDLYTILRGGREDGRVNLTLVTTPLMRWIWLGGCVMGLGALVALWPAARRASPRSAKSSSSAAMGAKTSVPAPHGKPHVALASCRCHPSRHDIVRD